MVQEVGVILYRYVIIQVLLGFLIATAILLPLFGFFDLLDQLDDVGTGTYRTQDALLYTQTRMPRRLI